MNAEVIKEMNKKETKFDKARKWWNKNGYKVMRVILFPIWGCVWAKGKIGGRMTTVVGLIGMVVSGPFGCQALPCLEAAIC